MQACRKAPPRPLFLTPKSASAIPIADALHFDLLRQLALDPSVTRIGFVGRLAIDNATIRLHAFLVGRGDRRELTEIVESRATRTLDAEGLFLLACRELHAHPMRVTRSDIECEPVASNARTVWAQHDYDVSLRSRLRIADVIETFGPAPLRQLCATLGGDIAAIYALACQNELAIDLHGRLEDATVSLAACRSINRAPSLMQMEARA